MTAPSWHEPVATARREATRPLSRGLAVRPTLIGFDGDEPTLYVRGRLACDPGEAVLLSRELVALPALLGLSRLLVVSSGRLSGPDDEDTTVRDAVGAPAVMVDVAERAADGGVTTSAHVLPYAVGDAGQPSWEAPLELPDGGPWAPVLAYVVGGEWQVDEDRGLGPTGFAYALSRSGVVVGVAPGWSARYGFDRPVDPGQVRREDRRRASRHGRRRRQPTTAGGTT